ncbi:coiled-coil domain-containing protein 15 [Cololabis saira]|uniref:coiled-coil domain-containing protein 15 n=1 Tax=Cololabis saira TaxID=129043 RepID=UPI002AD463A8|nr:coiled-coil domain-containing protein 15 [Cololabis saira]
MSVDRVKTSTDRKKNVSSLSQTKEHRPFRASKVLAERSPAVVAVGAWVEAGEELPEHPATLALLTEELLARRRREEEERLRRFQDEVRHRVAQRTQVYKKRQHAQTPPAVKTHHKSPGKIQISERSTPQQKRSSVEPREGVRHARLRLAACQMVQDEEMASDLPGGRWNISPVRHRAESRVLRAEEDVLGEKDQEKEDEDHLFTDHHLCPFVQQKVGGHAQWDPDELNLRPGSSLSIPPVLWPLTEEDELRKQRQSQFLMHRRLFMNMERQQVKENKQHRKHLKRTARIKAEKEQLRMKEERRLERAQQIDEARKKLEKRELLILERLKLEEEETAAQLQRSKQEEKGKKAGRSVEALRAQMKERLSHAKLELPPLCYCASSFWDSHPNTCANNCVFHNNPKAYARALHSTMANLTLQ